MDLPRHQRTVNIGSARPYRDRAGALETANSGSELKSTVPVGRFSGALELPRFCDRELADLEGVALN